MTTEAWLAQVQHDKPKLVALLQAYHPANRQPGRRMEIWHGDVLAQKGDFITAPNAESACVGVRREIKDRFKDVDPLTFFDRAIEQGSVDRIAALLNDAWFGVPESTTCWQIEGFREAVALIEDMPEDDDEAR